MADASRDDVSSWEEDRVVAWVASLGKGMAEVAPLFKANNITGRRLLKLTDDKLVKIGIASLGIRDDIVDEIAKLQTLQDAGPFVSKHLQLVRDNGDLMIAQLQLQVHSDVIPALTGLVKSVREAIEVDVPGPNSENARTAIIAYLTQVVGQTKQMCSSAANDLSVLVVPVQILVDSVRAYLSNNPLPSAVAALSSSAQSAVAPPRSNKSATPLPSPFAKPPAGPVVMRQGSPGASMGKPVHQSGIPPEELVRTLYTSVTSLTLLNKSDANGAVMTEAVGSLVGTIVKLIKETDGAGNVLVDKYDLRESLVAHSSNAGKDVKAIASGNEGARESLRTSLNGISGSLMQFLDVHCSSTTNCAKCKRPVDSDCILCEGPNSCQRWFHRPCVGLQSGYFKHTGWLCGIAPCSAKRLEEEKQDSERKALRDKALQEREDETRRIRDEKARWEREKEQKKKKEEQEAREAKEREENERKAALVRLHNWEKESAKTTKEFNEADKRAQDLTGLSINQLESLDQWRRKDANAGNDQADESSPAPKTNIADLIMRSTAPERKQAPSAPSLSTPTSSNHRMGKKLSPADLGQLVFVAKAHATEDYDPVGEENAISFRKGEVIDVVSKGKDGWWEGVVEGHYGTFYHTFVEVAGSATGAATDEKTVSSTTAVDIGRHKSSKEKADVSVPKTSLSALGEAEYEGWLLVQTGASKKGGDWKKRWSVVANFALYHFENKEASAQAVGFVPLPSYTTASAHDVKQDFAFALEHPSARSYVLAAENQREMDLWIDVLRRAAELRTFEDELAAASTKPSISTKPKPVAESSAAPTKPAMAPKPLGPPPPKPKSLPNKELLTDASSPIAAEAAPAVAPSPVLKTMGSPANISPRLAAGHAPRQQGPATPSTEEETKKPSTASDAGAPPPRPTAPPNFAHIATKVTGLKPPGGSPASIPMAADDDDSDSDDDHTSAAAPASTGSPAAKIGVPHPPVNKAASGKKHVFKAPVPNITVKQLANATLMGWLTKQGGSNKNWKRRYFVLQNFAMYYFDSNKGDAKALGVIPLPSYTIEEVPKAETGKFYSFKASHQQAREYFFIAESQDHMFKWMAAMRCASKTEEYTGEQIS